MWAFKRSHGHHHRFYYGLILSICVLSWSIRPSLAEARRPPNYPYDDMPDTSFTCAGKVVGGYYADPDADCQMFHVCVQVDENDVRDFKFMCPNDTVFDQENFICANWFEIDCRSSTLFYDKNLQLFRQPEGSAASGGTSTTEEPSDQQRKQQEQQLKQLQVLEEQQAAQVFRQQQVLEQHEKRQQEHQRTQLKIIQEQQKQQEKQQVVGRKVPSFNAFANSRTTTTTTTTPAPHHHHHPPRNAEVKGEESVVEYDYYYYDDYSESTEQGHFYSNDDYDPKSPGRIIDPTNARPALLPIIPPAKIVPTTSSISKSNS